MTTVTLILARFACTAALKNNAPLPAAECRGCGAAPSPPDPTQHNTAAAADSGEEEEKPVVWEREE